MNNAWMFTIYLSMDRFSTNVQVTRHTRPRLVACTYHKNCYLYTLTTALCMFIYFMYIALTDVKAMYKR